MKIKEIILNETGGKGGLAFVCATVSSMVIVLALIGFYNRSPILEPEIIDPLAIYPIQDEKAYEDLEEYVRQEDLNEKLDAILEKLT